MIPRFGSNTALLLIDVQKGVNVLNHWGGPTGRRNNPEAECRMLELLAAFRNRGLKVFFSRHNSREMKSPLKLSLPTGDMLDGFEPNDNETIIFKDVNSVFVGTDFELRLREFHIERLVIAGFFTNFCVETTTRMSGNMGYDSYLAHDACSTCNRVGLDGIDYDPELVHDMAVASMHGEFCTALTADQLVGLTQGDNPLLNRVQGNE
ncbi:MAG: nicotinamidase-related amidase [Gammaproteobacteria bacterium]|jgi:nicotinamidase-related amidase